MPTPKKTTPHQTPAAPKNRKQTSGDSGDSAVEKKPNGQTSAANDSGNSRVDASANVKTVDLPLNVIIIDGDLQMRAGGTDEDLVEEYRVELLRSTRFPPVGVTLGDDGAYYLYSGFTRTEAAKRAGRKTIEATVRPGGKREAMLLAVAENAAHGKRRTRADVQRAIEALLLDPEWGTWSDGHVATKVATDPKTVGAARLRMIEDGRLQPADVRRGLDGRTYKAGRKPAAKKKSEAVAGAAETVAIDTADPVSEMFGAPTDVAVNEDVRSVEQVPERPADGILEAATERIEPTISATNSVVAAPSEVTSSLPATVTHDARRARETIDVLAREASLDVWISTGDDHDDLRGLASMLKDRFREFAKQNPDAAVEWLSAHHERLADLLPRGEDSDGAEI